MIEEERMFLLLQFVDSTLERRSELDRLHVGAVCSKA